MRKVLLGFGMGAAVLAMSAMMLMAAAPDEIVIDACANKKAAVTFPHKAHEGVGACSTCHHTQPDLEAGGEAEKCSDCHVKPEEEGVPACEQMSMSKNPFHIGCVGCHKKEEKGPTKCNDCHPKAE